ncbi:hypothetical protein C8R46DRAFT_1227109 [Mycena filopes]|nr:hypothetical protein C8R46DRAFT_1227109 [Mycena filopes]
MDVDLQSTAASTNNNPGLTRAEGLWFEDCGLIVQAETTIFRVSRDFLAFHSPVFKDMLSLPPPTGADLVDGCPFVLLPDTAEDVTVFLKALIHYETKDTALKFELEKADRVSLVILARQLSIEWILPVAFYRICQVPITASILDDSIPKPDQINIMNACGYLEGSAVSTMLAFLWPKSGPQVNAECISPADCHQSRIQYRRLREVWRQRKPVVRPLLPFEIWDSDDWEDLDVCHVCMASMALAHQEAMQKLWNGLPELFGLPAWADVQTMKEDALR